MHCIYYKVSFLQVWVFPVHGLSMLFKGWKGFCQMLCGNENFNSAAVLLLHCTFSETSDLLYTSSFCSFWYFL